MDISKQVISAAAAHVCGMHWLPSSSCLFSLHAVFNSTRNQRVVLAGIFIAILASGNGAGRVSQCAWYVRFQALCSKELWCDDVAAYGDPVGV